VWYYYTYKDGERVPAKSSGVGFTRERDRVKSRREAVNYCERLIEAGRLGEDRHNIALAKWVENKHFWNWHKSEYVRGILMRSDPEKPGITEGFVRNAGSITAKHIVPYHGNKPIDEITPFDCEQLLFQWTDQGASNKTANNWKSIYSTILGEYERELKMRNPKSDYYNPWRMVRPLQAAKNPYGALTIAEVSRLISPDGIDFGKKRNVMYYLAVKLSFMTGLRIGETCALIVKNIYDVEMKQGDTVIRGSYLHVTHSYDPKTQTRGPVKDKEARDIPISPALRDELEQFVSHGDSAYLFSFDPRHNTPLSAANLRGWLYKRMEDIGIQDRKKRNIAFHSTRRFFNTLLRHERIADDVIRRFTGHDSKEMTDHYTDYLPEDLQAISRAQSRLIEGEIKE